jgi:polyhydroxybutyrate depolymerase
VRHTPVSLLLTGREWRPKRKFRLGQAADRALDTIGDTLSAQAKRVPRRVVVVALVVAVVAAGGSITAAHLVSVANRTMNTTAATIQVGDMTRSYTVLTPAKKTLSSSAPIIMMLSGLNSEQDQEISRDGLLPYVQTGDAEVVYPLAYRESWNAIGCCSWAAKAAVDDVGFIQALVKRVDPDNERPIYLVGYSNGGRLAYTLACQDPLLFDGTAVVKADPQKGCNLAVQQKFLQVASTDDTDVPYSAGEKGHFRESPAAQVVNGNLRKVDQCPARSASSKSGNMTLTTWSDCLSDTSVSFAVYTAGVHSYPRPPVSFPDASQVIWAWINNTTTVTPQPKPKLKP